MADLSKTSEFRQRLERGLDEAEDKAWDSLRRYKFQMGVAFFFKQWGGVRKERTGRLLDGREWNEMPARC
jgi:protein gp37